MSTEQPNAEQKKPPIPKPAKKVPAYNIEKRGDRLYQVQSLHKWFAISSLLLFAFTVATVLQDYSREWKQYQREFNRMAVARTRDDAVAALGSIDRTQYDALAAQLQQARQEQAQNSAQIDQLEEQLTSLRARQTGINKNYQTTKADYDAEKYEYEEVLAHTPEKAEPLKTALDRREKEMNDYALELEQVNTEIAQVNDQLKQLEGKGVQAEKDMLAMRGEFDRLRRQLNTLNPPAFVTTLINAPLLDFMKPSLQIKQILLPKLFYDQPFKQISRADRCTTCHLGIDQKAWENAPQPFKTHPNMELYLGASSPHPMESFGCTSCHGGLDRSTDFQTAGHTPRDAAQKEEWEKKYHWHPEHYLETPMYSMPNVQAGCYKCHNSSPEVPGAAALDNGRDLIRLYGCFGCHKLPGYDGIRKVGPDLGGVSGKLTQDWVKKWLADPRGFKSEARMPKFWYNSNNTGLIDGIDWDKRNPTEINAITAYLWSKSTPKPLPSSSTPSGNVDRGKEIVENVGCFGCHSVGPIEEVENRTQTRRKHGYNLAAQGSKVPGNWIFNWVKDPHEVWADTKMPSLRLTDAEAADVTAYLSSLKNPEFDAKPAPATDTASLDQIVFEFKRAGSTEARAREEVAAMSVDQKNLYAGERLISRYGCYGCHNIPGFENAQPIGTELTEAGSKLISQLDFGFLDIEETRSDWYTQKLHDPRIFDKGRIKRPDEKLKMPNFGFSDKEVSSIVMVLTSMVKDSVALEMRDRTPPAVAEGRQLVAEKNCKGCHLIEGMGGDIRGYLKALDQQGQWPPNLNTQGQKTQPDWLHSFLKDPGSVRLRPWLNARMPTFHFTDHQAFAIGQYFSTLDKVDAAFVDPNIQSTPELMAAGAELFTKLQCALCHPTGSTLPPGRDPSDLAPNLFLAHDRLRPDWILERWLPDPQKVAPNTKMPTFWGFDEKTKKHVSQLPEILNGDAEAQMRAVRDYVFSLGTSNKVRVSSNR